MIDVDRLAGRLAATGPASEVRSPFDSRLLGPLATSTPDDLRSAAERARSAQPGWAARPIEDRAAVLLDFHDRVLAERDHLADLIQAEAGKSRMSAVEEVL